MRDSEDELTLPDLRTERSGLKPIPLDSGEFNEFDGGIERASEAEETGKNGREEGEENKHTLAASGAAALVLGAIVDERS